MLVASTSTAFEARARVKQGSECTPAVTRRSGGASIKFPPTCEWKNEEVVWRDLRGGT